MRVLDWQAPEVDEGQASALAAGIGGRRLTARVLIARGMAQLALGRERGLHIIVIDHHQIPSGESAAFALINPHRADDQFPFKGLASCGVAFYLAAALRSRLRDRGGVFDPRDLLDLVALGSVA